MILRQSVHLNNFIWQSLKELKCTEISIQCNTWITWTAWKGKLKTSNFSLSKNREKLNTYYVIFHNLKDYNSWACDWCFNSFQAIIYMNVAQASNNPCNMHIYIFFYMYYRVFLSWPITFVFASHKAICSIKNIRRLLLCLAYFD